MMSFYSEFSKNYDKIFPLNQKKLILMEETFSDLKKNGVKKPTLLDVGCGTGNYALALAERGFNLKAVDLDPEMIALAEEKKESGQHSVDFFEMGMLEIKDAFARKSFSGIYIIGNVLVHLKNKNEIGQFLKDTADLLQSQGKLFIQIVNYKRILEQDLEGLPTISSEDGSLRFERKYKYDSQKNIIHFKTELISEKDEQKIHGNKIPLYPLNKDELLFLLQEARFEIKDLYGSYSVKPFNSAKSIPLIVTAERK